MFAKNAFSVTSAVLFILAFGVSQAAAVGVYDDFEDGDWTANPAWYNANPGYGVDGGIVPDPIRANNLVWKAMGSEAAARMIGTREFAPMPWIGFRCSSEYLTMTGSRFGGHVIVRDVTWDDVSTCEEAYGFHLLHDITWGGQAALAINGKEPGSDIKFTQETWFDVSLIPINEWLRLDMWHESASGLIRGEVRRASDNGLIVGMSYAPATFGGPSPVGYLSIGAQELEWQYMDNPMLMPEPTSLSLIALVGLAVMSRRRRR